MADWSKQTKSTGFTDVANWILDAGVWDDRAQWQDGAEMPGEDDEQGVWTAADEPED